MAEKSARSTVCKRVLTIDSALISSMVLTSLKAWLRLT